MSKDLKVGIDEKCDRSVVTIADGITCGGRDLLIVGGPCSVESMEQMEEVASALEGSGVTALRGGVYKPRTSPYAFQGLREAGLEILNKISSKHRVPVITEVMSESQAEAAKDLVDAFQIGSRNMQNFELLKAVGALGKPVILKRGLSATLEELVLAAEYIASCGTMDIILCERGIRSFDSATRNVLDLGGVVALKQMTHLPVIVDPSHATGRSELIADLARAAVACGADGLLIECHPEPEKSVSDARQALSLQEMIDIVDSLVPIAEAVGRTIPGRDSSINCQPEEKKSSEVVLAAMPGLEHRLDSILPGAACRTAAETDNRISGLRDEIDSVDSEIAKLLARRLNLALEIGGLKQELNLPWRDSHREKDVLSAVLAGADDVIMGEYIKGIYEKIIELSREAQSERSASRVA